ncbi:MAG: hypothetical protein M1833_004484 [Piccolia ochrophora]|nr:MAG: hypothetical protein M1833_004484 [Piccolia ochrophora]
MAAAVDLPYLSSYLNLTQPTLSSLTDAPTTDLVNSVLQAVAAKAREHDEVKAEKLRSDVALENAVRSGESRARGLKANVDKALKEAAELREKLNEEEEARSAIDAELQSIRSSSSTSSSELQALRSRISSLETSNRETLQLLDAKSTACDRLNEDLSAQHRKTIELRQEISGYEQKLQAASSASTSAKFRESTLEQEFELTKKSNEWYEAELKTKSSELAKIRKEKGATISELQRQNEEANSTVESLRRTETTIRNRLDEVSQKADQAFSRIQQLQEDAANEKESSRKELEGAQRLAQLFEDSVKTARDRLQDVQASLEQSKDDAAEEVRQVNVELEKERDEKERAEQRISELEVEVERLEGEITTIQNAQSLPAATPRRSINGASTPGRDASFSPGGSRVKGSLSSTQMYTEYINVKSELDREKKRNEKLSVTMDDMIRDLESKRPEIEELKSEHDRLEAEVVEISSLLEETGKDRDRAHKEARKWQGQVAGKEREGELLRQQLRDLSAQVKLLVSEIHARENGLEDLSAAEQMQLERLARGELDEEALEGLNDTGKLISQRLTVFKNIDQLQEQNINLLRITRELGDKMEGEEAMQQQSQHAQDREELQSLRAKVDKYKDEMKSMVTKSQSYIKERDMFRRMLQHRGQIPPNADVASMFGQSFQGGTPDGSRAQSPNAKDASDLGKVIKEMQQHFDAYREEASTDQRALKEQSERLSREKSDLQADIARTSSQVTLAHERFEMLQANYNMLKSENGELQKRSNALSESAAMQDLKTQQVAEELVEARAIVDGMRNETANLKAEKDLWKRIEKRLSDDNENLMNETGRLNALMRDLQNLQNQRELSDSETRRKLQAQVETLESELQSTKRKLNEEVEDAKKATLRRELEQQQSQRSIDDLRAALSAVREELVAAKTTKDHLQARVDELSIELRSAEERVQVLQPRPTARSGAASASANGPVPAEAADGEEESLSREQELAVEVSELKRDLELTRTELESAKTQVEQYKAISQSSEEELQSMNETHDQYREELDRLISERDAKIRNLEERIVDITSELSSSNTELSTLRSEQGDKARRFEDEKAIFEGEIARLKDEDERHASAAQFHQEDLKAQAEIAQQAQQNYDNELVKHAEATKTLQRLRTDYNQLRTEVATYRTEAEAAKVALNQSESSWEETKGRYDKELVDMRTRRDEVDQQNKLLHQQLENVSKQISALQQQRFSSTDGGPEGAVSPTPTPDQAVSDLREVIAFLRRDKEIVDVQYELSVQESRRLKQQLDYAQSQLEANRLTLDQERRAHAQSDQSSMTHSDLMQKINELNLYRESTVTLRNEARQAQEQLVAKSAQVDNLFAQIQPLKATIQELENEKESREGEIKLLQEDRDRWQQRNQNILQKYDRVDPAELEALKADLASIKAERDELQGSQQPLKDEVDGFPAAMERAREEAVAPWRERQEKQVAQFKERSRLLTTQKNEKVAEVQAITAENHELEQELENLRQALETAKENQRSDDVDKEQRIALETGTSSQPHEGDTAALEARVAVLEQQIEQERTKSQNVQSEVDARQSQIVELEARINELEEKLREANEKSNAMQRVRSDEQQSADNFTRSSAEQLEHAQLELSRAKEEIESLQTNAAVNASLAAMPSEEGSLSTEQISEHVKTIKQELESQQAERIQQAEDRFNKRVDGMKSQLNKKLAEGKDKIRQELNAEHDQAVRNLELKHEQGIANLKSEREQEIQSINDQHQLDLDNLRNEEATRLEQEKQKWLVEHPQGQPMDSNSGTGPVTITSEPGKDWKPSDSWTKNFLATNATIKAIVARNITQKMNQEKDERLTELQKKCDSEKEKAVAMEAQRQKVKLSMAEGKARGLTTKVDIVSKAATETPQRAVGEVWDIAKVAKPAPSAIAVPQPSSAPSAQSQFTPQSATAPAPQQNIPTTQPKPPTPVRKETSVQQAPVAEQVPRVATPTSLPSATEPANDQPQQSPSTQQPASALPAKPPQGQSGIPRGGAAPRGTRLPRGGGRGRGQANLSAGAKQFVPGGNKRPREESTGENAGRGGGKRPRGGGAGGTGGAGESEAA